MKWAHPCLLLMMMLQTAGAQTGDAVMRTSNSVDIQVCVNTAFLTPQRDVFQGALWTYLTGSLLNNNGLYLDRQYTTSQGNLCYLYVFQAPNPHLATMALAMLTSHSSILVPLSDTSIQCGLSAAQWSGDNLSYLGAPFPLLWTVNDLVLWGGCVLGVLFLCMSGLCCFAMCKIQFSNKKLAPSNKEEAKKKVDNSILKIPPKKSAAPTNDSMLKLSSKV